MHIGEIQTTRVVEVHVHNTEQSSLNPSNLIDLWLSMVRISPLHPRAESLRIREKLTRGFEMGLVVPEGLAAHGRGEAFDYILGEDTTKQAEKAVEAAVSMLLMAKHPVISVNGNVAALVPTDIVRLAQIVKAKIEVNLFHGSPEREKAIARWLRKHGAKEVLGIGRRFSTRINEIHSDRRKVDRRGIAAADVVFVSLEDGDRTEALKKLGKKVIAIDLNPMSRTAQTADVTIVDNIVRALPLMVKRARHLSRVPQARLRDIVGNFDNEATLGETLKFMYERLKKLADRRFPFF
jgi:4-phosphopantoate--beta-alanine ligase